MLYQSLCESLGIYWICILSIKVRMTLNYLEFI